MYTSDKFIITQLQEYFIQEEENREHEKTSFWASEAEKPVFDLYHQWLGTKPTNPMSAEKLLMFNTGKMIELSLIDKMTKAGLAKKIEDDEQQRIEIEREGVKVSGYLDGTLTNGDPLEIKSFYGYCQLKELKEGKPKTSYLKQLAIYMDALNREKGKLIYIERGTGEMFEFTLLREGTKFKCMTIEFDLTDTYKRWARLYKNNIVPKIEPKSEYRYKYPIEEIDWSKVSKADISKVLAGKKVIGDWQVLYSPYKNLIVEREGTTLGYTEKELQKIKSILNK